jgi:hypothetical protein
MHRVTANPVANRPAETSAGAYSCLHATQMLLNTVGAQASFLSIQLVRYYRYSVVRERTLACYAGLEHPTTGD